MSGWLEKMPGIRDIVYGLVTMPRRSKLKFTGAGVSVADDGTQTVVTVSGGGGGGGGYTESEVSDTIAGTLDNYSPTGWADCTSLVLTGTGTITGFAAPGAGKPLFRRIVVTGASAVTITHLGASSSVGNKVECPNPFDAALSYDVTLTRGSSAWIVYNTASARWQLVSLAGRDRYQSPPLYISGTAVVGISAWAGADNAVVTAAGPGPYVIQGLTAPSDTSGARGTLKLIRFAIACTIRHEDVTVGTAANRVRVTTGADWTAAVDDLAILSYEMTLGRWVLHPLKPSSAPTPGTTNATARTFAANVMQVWTSGSATPTFTFSSGSAVNGVEEIIFFPASTLTSITLSSDLDPTGTVTYTFDDALSAYVLHMKYLGVGPCIVSTMRKVTDLP